MVNNVCTACVTLLPYSYEITCGCIAKNRKNELTKIQRKKNFINQLKNAEKEIFCICIEIIKNYKGDDTEKKDSRFNNIKR